MKAKLFTADGGFVTDFVMPPFQKLPEVCIWGSRTFALREATTPSYYEVCAWSVDASKVLCP